MDITVTYSAPAATATAVPDFPLVRFDTGLVIYQEALLNGQYLVANTSAMGRPKPREWVWSALKGGAASSRPLRTRQHAFQLEVDGQLLTDRWEWVGAEEIAPGHAGCRELVVRLRHSQRSIAVAIHTLLDDTSFLTRWLAITNTGERPAALAQVYPWSGQVWEPVGHPWVTTELAALKGSPFTLGRFTDTSAGAEGSFDWMSLPDGAYRLENLQGRSGWGIPMCILHNEVMGENLVAHFACSGNWQIELYNDHEPANRPHNEARVYARLGLAGPAPLWVLEPGETACTPPVHLGFLYGDLDDCVQALHAHERKSVLLPEPAGLELRTEVNHTGYTRNAQVTERQLVEDIDVASDVGVELFLLDAGWFGGGKENWWETVGDWDRESPLIEHGVKAIFEYAHRKGMLCGLWVEAERMGPASRLLKEHPDWQMTRRGEKIPNLDLARPEVARYLEETIVGLIERYQLDCFRLDYNISIGEGGEAEHGGYTENILWRYDEALHGIFERVHQRYPTLLLENCSSGGGRNDLGMMARFHWTQVSDRWAPVPALKIINGVTLALPPERCETFPGAITDGVADIDFMLRVGLFGHFSMSGIFPTMRERSSPAREYWVHALELYKSFCRPILASSRLYHHTPIQRQTEMGDWVVLECVSQDQTRAYAGIFRLGGAQGESYHFLPRGLDASRRYRVTCDNSGQARVMDGGALLDEGLRVRLPGAFTSELLLFEAIG